MNVFSDPTLQAGVAELALYGATLGLERLLGVPQFQLTSLVVHAAVTFGVTGLAALPYLLRGRRAPRELLLFVGVLALLYGIGSGLYISGHPAQFFIPGLWVLAASSALRGQGEAGGLLVVAAAAFEPWGVLGAPVLLLLPGLRALVRGGVALVLGLLCVYGPFILLGDFAMHRFDWTVRQGSLLAGWLGVDAPFGWELRILQGAAALLAGGVVAWSQRDQASAIWSVPAAIVAARLLIDPIGADYYWIAVRILFFVALASFLADADWRGLLVMPALYMVFLPPLLPGWSIATAVLLATAATSVGTRTAAPRKLAEDRGRHRASCYDVLP